MSTRFSTALAYLCQIVKPAVTITYSWVPCSLSTNTHTTGSSTESA